MLHVFENHNFTARTPNAIHFEKYWLMKSYPLCFLLLIFFNSVQSQIINTEKCNSIIVDILDGKVNRARPDFTPDRIRLELPCATSSFMESDTSMCDGRIIYADKHLTFFTQKDYVEIREAYSGKWTIPVMGAAKGSLFNYLGNPKVKQEKFEAYATAYGTLVLYYNDAGKVRLVRMSTNTHEFASFCD